MTTTIVTINEGAAGNREEQLLKQAGEILRRGGLVVFPTETVYGLGGDAFQKEAARRIYEAKGRPSDNPLIVHIAEEQSLYDLCRGGRAQVPEMAQLLAKAFWPGPLTMVLPKTETLPYETTGGLDTVAIRFPAHETARKLISYAGGFVAAPSANRSGRPSPTSARHCIEDLNGRVDMIIDGGDSVIGLESTVVDVTGEEPVILRPGRVTEEEIRRVLGVSGKTSPSVVPEDDRPRAPGMKYRHYAPQGSLTVVRGAPEAVTAYIRRETEKAERAGKKTGVIATEETGNAYQADTVLTCGRSGHPEEAAHHLYRVLRSMDEAGAEAIFCEAQGFFGMGGALENRLFKACGGNIVDV